MQRTYIKDLTSLALGSSVKLCGWVHRRRDLGGVIFIELREHTGLIQIVCNEDADSLRREYVIEIEGTIQKRPEGTTNAKMPTSEIEIVASKLSILNSADTPPFSPADNKSTSEELRLKYRYLDLRDSKMQANLRMRSKLSSYMRNFLIERNFLEVETPILTKSTPEGARDYLVPSRQHLGEFFALPQSPQLFKQTLMMGGIDRYFQIARCFRDEDLRADRQPEFTQLDIETSFLDAKQIMTLMEEMIKGAFTELLEAKLGEFPIMTYKQALEEYGIDRPDLRNPLKLRSLDPLFQDCSWPIFQQAAQNPKQRIIALRIPGGIAPISRKNIEEYTTSLKQHGIEGLSYVKVENELSSPIAKFIGAEALEQISKLCSAQNGDLILIAAGNRNKINAAFASLRQKIAEQLNLIAEGWHFLWIVDFPLFEQDEQAKWQAVHHPFTSPAEANPEQLKSNPGACLANAYDLVLNGLELGGGSIRIHNTQMQMAIFEILGIDAEQAQAKFGFLLEALRYGCPPHGGLAFGVDRIAMLMSGANSIREVIAFPKTQMATCPLMDAPSVVDSSQLQDLGINISKLIQGTGTII